MRKIFIHIWLPGVALLFSCNTPDHDQRQAGADQLYQVLTPRRSGISFVNKLTENNDVNYFFYPDLYGGGGAAVGDINNDGLSDIYLTSILVRNALYLNKGNLQFEDITEQAGVHGAGKWTRGVTMADVNNDGYLDIYVSVGGPLPDRKNLLFINKKDNTFEEQAEAYGIADEGYSVQSAFFDYDKDGDLDLYVGNNTPTAFQSRNVYYAEKMKNPAPHETDKLYRNDGNNHFTEVTDEAGITNFGLTLGLSISDFNNDGWFDIYVSNDFNSPDYLYINNGDGTFSNEVRRYLMHTAQFGMGSDAADFNNDGLVDLVQLDMSYSSNQKKKTNMPTMWPEQFYEMIDLGLHRQYMRNCLQMNTGLNAFSDVAQIAGVGSTDWSWGSLFMDMNNDGYKDLFITNGMRRDVNDNDFLSYVKKVDASGQIDPTNSMELLEKMPVNPVDNYVYLNNADLTFRYQEGNHGLSFKGFSHGAAYADLDNDGDLDVVVNNLDDFSQVFENISNGRAGNYFIRFRLRTKGDNRFAIGSKVKVYHQGKLQLQELVPTRGYLSAAEPVLHFGLGHVEKIDSVTITWPDGSEQHLYDLEPNQLITVMQDENAAAPGSRKEKQHLFTTLGPELAPPYVHRENDFNDFDREVLLPHRMSQFGPALAVADVNNDGLDDFFVGGAMGYSGRLYIQGRDGKFKAVDDELWSQEKQHEDVSALFFDANGDGAPDLYVASGGNEKAAGHPIYQDRLYINNGQGGFARNGGALPPLYESTSRVKGMDFDQDGDLDLFIGGRQVPGRYPMPANSYLLRNDSERGRVAFTDITEEAAPMLADMGMVTDAVWTDYNADGWQDLILVGEWMPVTLLENRQGSFADISNDLDLDQQVGWWFSIAAADVDLDGDMDFVAGNLGLNYKYKASPDEPFEIYSQDFDDNGNLDIVLAYYDQHQLYPLRGRTCSSQQVPAIKEKFVNYFDFANADLADVYGEKKLASALHYQATTFATTLFLNEGDHFVGKKLDQYAQLSSVNVVEIADFNGDSKPDLFLAGNLFESEVETPRADAAFGLYLAGDGNGNFSSVPPHRSGLLVVGEVRESARIKMADGAQGILLSRNEGRLALVKVRGKELVY